MCSLTLANHNAYANSKLNLRDYSAGLPNNICGTIYLHLQTSSESKLHNGNNITNRARGLNREDAMDRARWRKLIGMIDDYDESSG